MSTFAWFYFILKNAANQSSRVRRAKQNRLILLSSCTICGKEKSKFIKNEEAGEILSQLGIRHPSSNIPLIGDILFW